MILPCHFCITHHSLSIVSLHSIPIIFSTQPVYWAGVSNISSTGKFLMSKQSPPPFPPTTTCDCKDIPLVGSTENVTDLKWIDESHHLKCSTTFLPSMLAKGSSWPKPTQHMGPIVVRTTWVMKIIWWWQCSGKALWFRPIYENSGICSIIWECKMHFTDL